MLAHKLPELLPQILVFNRVLLAILPAVAQPAMYPALLKAVHHISRVTIYLHLTRLLKQTEAFNNRLNFHTIIRCMLLSARYFLLMSAIE
ncbi:hypothetical protein D3C80_1973320 [compost metagenome]